MKNRLIITVILISFFFVGWGSVGHRIINRNFILSNHPELNFLSFWADSLAAHGSDADNRKSIDPTEENKHYIDIDNYPNFLSTRRIIQDWDSVIAVYGQAFVMDQGILPWAILASVDSLTRQFQRKDWQKAMLTAADIGHYVGDGHMPLHITRNYNGQYTGQSGVHSRYESTMIGRYSNEIIYTGDSCQYIDDLPNFVFGFLYSNYNFVDSVLLYDIQAKNEAGGSYNNIYYLQYWQKSKNFTIMLFRNTSNILARIIYTAWVNAGKPTMTTSVEKDDMARKGLSLNVYPNPFTTNLNIRYSLPRKYEGKIKIELFDITGKELSKIYEGEPSAPDNEMTFTPKDRSITTGVYILRYSAGNTSISKKILHIKQ